MCVYMYCYTLTVICFDLLPLGCFAGVVIHRRRRRTPAPRLAPPSDRLVRDLVQD